MFTQTSLILLATAIALALLVGAWLYLTVIQYRQHRQRQQRRQTMTPQERADDEHREAIERIEIEDNARVW